MRKTALLALALFAAMPLGAQYPMEKFPNYKDFSIPKPDRSTKITDNDLVLTDSFLDLYPEGDPIAGNKELHELYSFFRNDPDGQKEWKGMVSKTKRIISSWDISKSPGFGKNRYIYSLGSLRPLATVYMFTGNELISTFIRGHLAKIAALPLDFWVHAELRGLNPKKPAGALETAILNKSIGFALAAVKKDMDEDEIRTIETAWYEKGHKTAFNWLDRFRPNNWTAVIGSGLLYSAKYFNDPESKQRGIDALKFYADNTIETDGSYSEGPGYFTYPVNNLFDAMLVMTPEEIEYTFGQSNLKGSAEWTVWQMAFNTDKDGKPGVLRLCYGDNVYVANNLHGVDKPSFIGEYIYRDSYAAWLRQRYECRNSSETVILASKLGGERVETESPAQAGFSNIKAFESGDCYIRDGWEDNGIVLSLKSGDHGSRVNHAHSRPELNSILLAAFGEYIIVAPASASYRSRIHNEYDVCTRSANTITIDGKNQKHPHKPQFKEGRWDNRDVWVKGDAKAVVTRCESLEGGDAILRSEATDAYHIPMKEASRTVRFIADGGFFIMTDRMAPEDGDSHLYDYRLHIFNRDDATVISGKQNNLKVQRGEADLYIAMTSNAKMSLSKNDGYLHAPTSRDYDENGPGQGKPGSAIELDWQGKKSGGLEVTCVLYPKHAGDKAPKIKLSKGKVTVDGKTYEIPE